MNTGSSTHLLSRVGESGDPSTVAGTHVVSESVDPSTVAGAHVSGVFDDDPSTVAGQNTSSQEQHTVPLVIGFYKCKRPFGQFSNFYYAPFVFNMPNFCYPSTCWKQTIVCEVAEKAIMLVKAALMEDRIIFEEIIKTEDPAAIKKLGQRVSNLSQQKWDEHVEAVAFEVTKQKFESSIDLRDHLLSTESHILAEASPDDRIWGIGIDINDPRLQDPSQWKGRNILGNALMKTRLHLRATLTPSSIVAEEVIG